MPCDVSCGCEFSQACCECKFKDMCDMACDEKCGCEQSPRCCECVVYGTCEEECCEECEIVLPDTPEPQHPLPPVAKKLLEKEVSP